MMVMVFHLAFSWAWADSGIARLMPNLPSFPELTSVAWVGWVGVEIFFVLSGFVIAYSAEGSSAFGFFRGRFLRLMPAVWICASVVLIVLLVGDFAPVQELTRYYLETLVLFPKHPWIDSVYWSLCVEIFFYGYILGLLIVNRFCQLEFFIGALGIASALVGVMFRVALVMPALFTLRPILERVYSSWTLQLLLIRHGCLFALGAYLWLLLFKGVTLRRLIIAGICFVGGYVETLWTATEQSRQVRMQLPIVAPSVIWLIFILLIVASIAMNDRAYAWAGARVRAIRMLGLMTFPLYLLHNTVGNAVIVTLHVQGVPRFLALIVALTICIFASWIVAVALEPGLKQWLKPIFGALEGWLGRAARIPFLLRATTPAT
jgi:peptidoglycan/LPS O-acetylase OafA/YrhL